MRKSQASDLRKRRSHGRVDVRYVRFGEKMRKCEKENEKVEKENEKLKPLTCTNTPDLRNSPSPALTHKNRENLLNTPLDSPISMLYTSHMTNHNEEYVRLIATMWSFNNSTNTLRGIRLDTEPYLFTPISDSQSKVRVNYLVMSYDRVLATYSPLMGWKLHDDGSLSVTNKRHASLVRKAMALPPININSL